MGDYVTLVDFVNADAPAPFKIDGASKLFKYPDLAINHAARYVEQVHGTGPSYLNRDIIRAYIDQITAIAQMAANTSKGKVVFIDSEDGLTAYACARQTRKKVVSVHSTKESYDYGRSVYDSFEIMENLEFKKGKLEDVIDDLQTGDTVVCLGNEQWQQRELVDYVHHKNLNVILGVTWNKTFGSKSRSELSGNRLVYPKFEQVEEKFLKDLPDSLEAIASPDPYHSMTTYLLIRPKRKKPNKVIEFFKDAATVLFWSTILCGATHLTFNYTPVGPYVGQKVLDVKKLPDKYSREKLFERMFILDFSKFAYEESLKRLENDPNDLHISLASYSGARYYIALGMEEPLLPSSEDLGWKILWSKKWKEASEGLPAPRELFIDDFIKQTEKLKTRLEAIPQPDDGLYTKVQKSIDSAKFRLEAMNAIKEHGLHSEPWRKIQIERVQYTQSPWYKLRDIEIRDGHLGLAAVEHRWWTNIVNLTLENNDSLEFPLPSNADVCGVAQIMAIEEHWGRKGIDPKQVPHFYLHYGYREQMEDNLRMQGLSEAQIKDVYRDSLIVDDPTHPDFAKEREKVWRSWGYSDEVIGKILDMEAANLDPNEKWVLPLCKVMDLNDYEERSKKKLQRHFRESGISVAEVKNVLLEQGYDEDYVTRIIRENLLNPIVIDFNLLNPTDPNLPEPNLLEHIVLDPNL